MCPKCVSGYCEEIELEQGDGWEAGRPLECKSGDADKGSGQGSSISEMKGWPWDMHTSQKEGEAGDPRGLGGLGSCMDDGVHH